MEYPIHHFFVSIVLVLGLASMLEEGIEGAYINSGAGAQRPM